MNIVYCRYPDPCSHPSLRPPKALAAFCQGPVETFRLQRLLYVFGLSGQSFIVYSAADGDGRLGREPFRGYYYLF